MELFDVSITFHLIFLIISGGFFLFTLARIVQRLYFRRKGHRQYSFSYSPRQRLEELLRSSHITISDHQMRSSVDHTLLKYRRLGKGKLIYLLANGVGTDFFIWLALIRFLLHYKPDLFDHITLITFEYRGLFTPDDEYERIYQKRDVEITIDRCVEDVRDIMRDSNYTTLDGLIGWSTGAQVGLAFAVKYSKHVKSLLLFNPSIGKTLHSALQPYFALPFFVRKPIGVFFNGFMRFLKSLVATNVWTVLRDFSDTPRFFTILNLVSFLGGFPPDQPIYFHEYCKDIFISRSHTRNLIDLILSLDEELPNAIYDVEHKTMIISGTPDFLTGVYHSKTLEKRLKNVKRFNYTMGSHWVLIEWPELIAKDVLEFIFEHKK